MSGPNPKPGTPLPSDPGVAPSARSASEPGSPGPNASRRSPRRLGRRVAQVVYWGLVVLVSIISAVHVTRGVFFEPPGPPFASCHDGLRALHTAVDRARLAAATTSEEAIGADQALERFRRALEPEWRSRDTVAAQCKGSVPDERALDAIERLRYAEEHAVRREAGELAPLRRRVQAIIDRELPPASRP